MDFFVDFDAFDDDAEVLEVIDHGFPRRVYDRADYFHTMDDLSFFKRFRLTKHTVLNLLPLLENQLEFFHNRNHSVSPINQLLVALRFYSTGSHILTIADFTGIHASTATRIIRKVSIALAQLAPIYIKLPTTPDDIKKANNAFFDIASFPNVIGAIDGTHVKIQSPGGEDAEVFRNRKQYFSINVQVICDADMMINDIVARWPGSTHDTTIFNSSSIKRKFEDNDYPNCFLLGDSAYALKKYLLTPVVNPRGEAEQLYNESHIRSRGVIEKLFGIWKRRFPVLAYGCRLKLQNTLTVIVATSVLHNIARKMGEQEPPVPVEIDEHELQRLLRNGEVPIFINEGRHNNVLGQIVRQNLINNYFGEL